MHAFNGIRVVKKFLYLLNFGGNEAIRQPFTGVE